MDKPGRYFRTVRAIAKVLKPVKYVQPASDLPMPCVLLCRHRNLRGPIYTIINMTDNSRPWIYYPFCEKETFFAQMYGYTLTKRLNWPKWCAWIVARLAAALIPSLIHSMGGIPVYRNDGRIRETFRLSLDALSKGGNILIYPDIDYTSTSDTVGEIYDGFFLMERMYHRQTGRHLPFVPVHLDVKRKRLTFGKSVVFGDGDFSAEKEKAKEEILRQWRDAA